jgi:acyl-homoserine lactone acylase PvdQ
MGANYRLISDLGENGMWAVESQGQSGHPGSDHYCDQLVEWLEGRYHFLALGAEGALDQAESICVLEPANEGHH